MFDIAPGSFRDRAGFMFIRNNELYRQINKYSEKDYNEFINTNLYNQLVEQKLAVSFDEADIEPPLPDIAYKIIKPQRIPFLSYAYEWSFSQLKDAALLTLEIQKRSLCNNMSLKDASAYNVQFLDGKPIFIDSLSFEIHEEGKPWVAYKQFCQHFLAPLALMSKTDIRLNQLLRVHLDGIPLQLAVALMPFKSRFSSNLYLHLHLHARFQQRYAGKYTSINEMKSIFSRKAFLALLESLERAVEKLEWKPETTEWYNYYKKNNNYGREGLENKERIVSAFLDRVKPKTVWDLGANIGLFSRVAASKGAFVVAWDSDPGCVEHNYRMVRKSGEANILPLLLDLANPSPGIGWENSERMSFAARGPTDLILALGLMHHLHIGNNVPFAMMASFFAGIGEWLIVEFIPKDDSQVQKLLVARKDVFESYSHEYFVSSFEKFFSVLEQVNIPETKRSLFLMKKRNIAGP